MALKYAKMERKLYLLETYSSRSQETHPYFVQDNLEKNNFHCWYWVSSIKIEEKKHPYTRFKTFRITPTRVNSAKHASLAGAEILSQCLIHALISE